MINSIKTLRRDNNVEYWNVLTHAFGFLFSILGCYFMVLKTGFSDTTEYIPVLVFTGSLIILFAISTLYHFFWDRSFAYKFRILDHISIYMVIAGTYTPFMCILYDNEVGNFLLKALWGIALFGTIFKLFFTGKFEKFSLALYFAMGWLVVFRLDILLEKTPNLSLAYLVIGGLSYSIGAYFYANDRIPYNHPIWHLFVLGGAVFHYLAIYSFL